MDTFQPSQHSHYGALPVEAFQAIGAGIQVAGTLAATGISVGAAATAQKSQQKHEKELAKEQQKLTKLQAAAASAQASAAQADAVVQAQGTSSTLYTIGGVVLVAVLLSGTALFVFRKSSPRMEEAEEEEE